VLEQLVFLPFYINPLVGALAWAALGGPNSGLINLLWRTVGGSGPLINIYSPTGIAWVMALFEGSVAIVIISAAMKSMDPALEESSLVLGAGKLRTMTRITLPLLIPAVLGATILVFADMLGSFSAPAVIGMPDRFYVATSAIYSLVRGYPPDYPSAAIMGLILVILIGGLMFLYGRIVSRSSFVTISGKAFRPRVVSMGRLTWVLLGAVLLYVFLAVVLPILALSYASVLRFVTIIPKEVQWTLENYRDAFASASVRQAVKNSLFLGVLTATIGVAFMGLISWTIYRSRMPGVRFLEYVAMSPVSVPRMVFGLGLLMGWVIIPLPIYGTLWVMLIGYLTVMLPLGVRAISGVILQLDNSLEECARVCGASWLYQLRTVTMPLLRPGLVAAWMLLFIAAVREVGTSVLLMGPGSKVLGPAIIASWESSGQQMTAAMALIQMLIVAIALAFLLGIVKRVSRIEGD
jgi:iron(III) transport system permease protein